MISRELNNEMDQMQVELRKLLNDESLVLREQATLDKLLKRFDFTIEYLLTSDIMQLTGQELLNRKAVGLVTVPADSPAGRAFMLKRNVALMALITLHEGEHASV
jgi:hypothetical protein